MVNSANPVTVGSAIVANSALPGTFLTAESRYLSTPDTADLSIGDIDFMAAIWCNLSDVTTSQTLLSQYLGTGDQRSWIVYVVGGVFKMSCSSTGVGVAPFFTVVSAAAGSAVINTDHFILVWNNVATNTINIQIDNGTVYSEAHDGGLFDSNADICVGGLSGGGSYISGLVSADFWKGRLLDINEIASLWGAGTGNRHPFSHLFIDSDGDVYMDDATDVIILGDKTGGADITISTAVNTVLMAQNPDLIIGTGDYDGDAETTAQLMANINGLIFASPGNHDDWVVGVRTGFNAFFQGGGYKKVSVPYVDFFLYDYFLKMDESGYLTLYEAFDIPLAARQASTQGVWLIAQLAASTAKWKVVVFHNSPWSSPIDYPGPAEDVELAENMQWDWATYGVDLILCGHYHFYERLLKNTGSGNVNIIITGTAGNTTDLARLSADSDSKAYFSDQDDADFAGGHLIEMSVSESQLQIDLSGIDVSYNVHAGKDQLILT
jgi:hypothetical protein